MCILLFDFDNFHTKRLYQFILPSLCMGVPIFPHSCQHWALSYIFTFAKLMCISQFLFHFFNYTWNWVSFHLLISLFLFCKLFIFFSYFYNVFQSENYFWSCSYFMLYALLLLLNNFTQKTNLIHYGCF